LMISAMPRFKIELNLESVIRKLKVKHQKSK